jgi:hypothetical protein
LTSLLKKFVATNAGRHAFSLFAQLGRLHLKPEFEGFVLRTVPLDGHGGSFPFEEGGSATGVHITDECRVPGGDPTSLDLCPKNSESFIWRPGGNLSACRQFAGR